MEYKTDAVLDIQGNAIFNASVRVLTESMQLATVYNASGEQIPNPVGTDKTGEYSVALPNGKYYEEISVNGTVYETKGPISFFDPIDAGISSVKDYGAKLDGISDDTFAIQDAIDYVASSGGGTVLIPFSGDVIVSGLVIKDFVALEGLGKNVTRIKLKSGANEHVIQGGDFDLNADGVIKSTPIGCRTGGLRKLTIDANKANQNSEKHCMAYYGIDLQLEEVEFKNAKGIGLAVECPGGTFSAVVGQNLQTSIRHIESHDNDSGNLNYNGQSDSVLVDMMFYTTGNGLGQCNARFGSKASGAKIFGMHCWGASDYGVISEAGLIEFTGCHVESAALAKVWAKQPIMWHGGRVYEASANNGAVGFKLDKDYNQIRGVTATSIHGGLIDTSAGGVAGQNSIIEVFGYASAAGALLSVGTMSGNSDLDLRLFGLTNSSLLQSSQRAIFRQGLLANGVITAGAGGLDMNSNGIDRCNYFASQGWAAAVISSGNLPIATSHVVISPSAAVDITDITSSVGEAGIMHITIRNGGVGAATFKQNVSKLRNNGVTDKIVNQYESISYTRISGAVWQQTGGK